MLHTGSHQARECAHLAKPVNRDSLVVLERRKIDLGDGGDDDFVASLVQLVGQESALDLGPPDVRRIVVGGEKYAHLAGEDGVVELEQRTGAIVPGRKSRWIGDRRPSELLDDGRGGFDRWGLESYDSRETVMCERA